MTNQKQTKNGLILLMIAAIIAIQFSACKKSCSEVTTEKLTITGQINGIIIEGPWEVTVTQDSIENSALLQYCSCANISSKILDNGCLHIKITNSVNANCRVFKATIKAYSLEKTEASGAVSIYTHGRFSSLKEITLSGASTLNGMNSIGTAAKISLSGASTLKDFTFNGNSMNAKISGASTFSGNGYAAQTNFTCSGASHIKTLNLESENLDINLSGASEVQITVNNTIKGSITGASTLKYKNATDVSGVYVSEESRIIKLN